MFDIINCYHDKFSGGIGDFIKGTSYLQKKCIKFGLDVGMDWSNHDINEYISSKYKTAEYDPKYIIDAEDFRFSSSLEDIEAEYRIRTGIDRVIDTINDDSFYKPAILSSWYSDLDHDTSEDRAQNISNSIVSSKCQNIVKDSIVFSKEINKLFKKLAPKDYGIVHFRLGDRHTLQDIDKELEQADDIIKTNYNLQQFKHDYDYYYYLIKKESKINNFKNTIILSDSNDFKKFIKDESAHKKNIHVLHCNSTHTSPSPGLLKYTEFKNPIKKTALRDTALDLKLIINSKKNITFSCYAWGSSFIIWPSKIYEIPFDVRVLDL